MCLNPIRLPRVTGSDAALVPCGKCAECLANKANDLTVRVVREAEYFKDFYFTTLTYDNEHIPIMESTVVTDNDFNQFVESATIHHDEAMAKEFFDKASYTIVFNNEGRPVKRYEPLSVSDIELLNLSDTELSRQTFLYYTTDNEDFKRFMKSARMKYLRTYGKPLPKFKYLCVPEYGGCSYRPHYHVLWLGLKEEQVQFMMSNWKLGSVADIQKVKYSTEDMSKVAHYVSQYANKGSHDCPYIEKVGIKKPRKCFSIEFGVGDEEDLNRRMSYWKCEDIFGQYDINDLSKFNEDEKCHLTESVLARRYYDLHGFKYPIPQYIKKKMFYTERDAFDLKVLCQKIKEDKLLTYEEKQRELRRITVRKVRTRDGSIKYKHVKPNETSKVASELQTMVTNALFQHLDRDLTADVERELIREVQSLVQITPENVIALQDVYVATQEDKRKAAELSLLNKTYDSVF